MSACVFCTQPETKVLVEDELARAFFDKYPVSAGHVLIIPKRHVASLFDATKEEMVSIGNLLRKVREQLDEQFHPDGYNVGINVGDAAGQTVFHLHVHVIPRYRGDAGSVKWHS